MDIKLATTFLKVAEIGNITKAAEQLGYSQASVTSHIQQLEQHLGVQLFDRIGRGIQLTDAGSEADNGIGGACFCGDCLQHDPVYGT
jgi:DNA-binding transcriptional LysR family regulator